MTRSRVIIAQDPAVFQGDALRQDVITAMLQRGLTTLLEIPDPQAAWQSLFAPDDIVGLKVNCLAGRGLSTHPEVASGLVEGLKLAGIPEEHVVIWDKANRDLKRGGYQITTTGRGVKCFGTDALRQGYESTISTAGQVGSLFSTILAKHCTAIVNVPILKDHDLSGVSIGLKNFYGAIHNPNKYHQQNCNPYIADLNTHPYITEKLRLTVCDALLPQYHGGPSYKPQWTWKFGAILMSLDPVALDAVGADILEQQRRAHGLESLQEAGRYPQYIHTAASYGLGQDQLAQIDILRC
ncbi:DUF362 domain-containing protein [candidate division KSB3 bacterium]|uniref:DUF362 domain-containing protein n=1 Tax=candidate division KSB3 bacterium TaxID=2044937 RepID=A0A9D5JTE2_9BACT|nr:DUF362 domain-containing protein [candidate division KSB3 bacterium]MBD3323755.1 DUF362 domain-containing protein [candidate division KSB3 bacterium]